MTHLTATEIEQYRHGTAAPSELLRLDDHLAGCEACRGSVAEQPLADAAAAALQQALCDDGPVEHPIHEQIVAYMDGALDHVDRELFEAHLEDCAMCREDLEDLRGLAASLRHLKAPRSGSRRGWFGLVGLAAAAAVAGVGLWVGSRRPEPAQSVVTTARQESAAPVVRQTNVVTLRDGDRTVTLDSGGTLTGLPSLGDGDRDAIITALRTGVAPVPAGIAMLAGTPGTLMSQEDGDQAFGPARPVGTAVEGVRPTFEWRPLAGASSYIVSIFDEQFQNVAESRPVTGTSWTPPHALERGKVYSWQVAATTRRGTEVTAPAPPAPEARFHILADRDARRIASFRQRHAGSPLTLGILLAGAGLLDDAERELQALVEANPDSALARELLLSIRQQRPVRRSAGGGGVQ